MKASLGSAGARGHAAPRRERLPGRAGSALLALLLLLIPLLPPAPAAAQSAGAAAAAGSAAPPGAVVATFTVGSSVATVAGRSVDLGFPVHVMAGGEVWAPLRPLVAAMGGSVLWDGAARTAYAERNEGEMLTATVGSQAIQTGTGPYDARTPVHILRAKTMVPLAAVAQAFGYAFAQDGGTVTFREEPVVALTEAVLARPSGTPLFAFSRPLLPLRLPAATTVRFAGASVDAATYAAAFARHTGHLMAFTRDASGSVDSFVHVYGYVAAQGAWTVGPGTSLEDATVEGSAGGQLRLQLAGGSTLVLQALAVPAYVLGSTSIGPELSPLWIPAGSTVRLVLWMGSPVALLWPQQAPPSS